MPHLLWFQRTESAEESSSVNIDAVAAVERLAVRQKEIIMHSQDQAVLLRAALYSFLAGVAAGIVYLAIAHFYAGMRVDGATLMGA